MVLKEREKMVADNENLPWSRSVSESRIARATSLASEMTGVSEVEIRGSSACDAVVAARWITWGLIWGEGFGCSAIAQAWGCNHATVINARDKGWGMEKAAPADGDGPIYIGAWG